MSLHSPGCWRRSEKTRRRRPLCPRRACCRCCQRDPAPAPSHARRAIRSSRCSLPLVRWMSRRMRRKSPPRAVLPWRFAHVFRSKESSAWWRAAPAPLLCGAGKRFVAQWSVLWKSTEWRWKRSAVRTGPTSSGARSARRESGCSGEGEVVASPLERRARPLCIMARVCPAPIVCLQKRAAMGRKSKQV